MIFTDKFCRGCKKHHPVSKFTPRRDDPRRLYDYCDDARKDILVRKNKAKVLANEYDALRSKAKEFRKLTYDQAVEIGTRNKAGETQLALAAEFNVSKSTISKAVRRPGIYR
jgi:hypothetical protein